MILSFVEFIERRIWYWLLVPDCRSQVAALSQRYDLHPGTGLGPDVGRGIHPAAVFADDGVDRAGENDASWVDEHLLAAGVQLAPAVLAPIVAGKGLKGDGAFREAVGRRRLR
jgi:hypothetical protein